MDKCKHKFTGTVRIDSNGGFLTKEIAYFTLYCEKCGKCIIKKMRFDK